MIDILIQLGCCLLALAMAVSFGVVLFVGTARIPGVHEPGYLHPDDRRTRRNDP